MNTKNKSVQNCSKQNEIERERKEFKRMMVPALGAQTQNVDFVKTVLNVGWM
jgi:hypothetical protein